MVLYLISGHYRQPLAFGAEQMEQAVAQVERLRNFFREHPVGEVGGGPVGATAGRLRRDLPDSRLEAFKDALADDFNTPQGDGRGVRAGRRSEPGRGAWSAPRRVREMLELLGLESLAEAEQGADDEAEALLAEREEARAAKDFGRADEIRDRLAELGWEVRDAEGGARLVPRG